jgi:DNA-binding LacI/PurR family transcriptional regulator
MPVLMRDVARRAGVSITTVSHVLNETRPVAEETRTRVVRAAAALNYYKNTSARLLVRGRSDLLGLVISDIENPFFPELIKSFEKACSQSRMEVLLCATNYELPQAEKAVTRMLENRVQGVAVMTSQFSRELALHLTKKKVPLVLLSSDKAGDYRSNIALNYRRGITDAVRHLYELGHRDVAIVTGPLRHVSALAFKEAVLEAVESSGLKPLCIREGDHGADSGGRVAREVLLAMCRPTAILCGNDRMAIGAMGAASALGFRVPDDISIIGADDVWMTRYCHPPLTTIRIPRDELGQLAFDVLMRMMNSRRKAGTEHLLDTQLVIRRSTGKAGIAGSELIAGNHASVLSQAAAKIAE